MLAARLIGGASSRLLPPSVPLRFLALAVLSHVAFWAALFAASEQLAGFRGGFAPLLAAVHLLTIGVLLCAAIGAAVQILPVVTRQPLVAVWRRQGRLVRGAGLFQNGRKIGAAVGPGGAGQNADQKQSDNGSHEQLSRMDRAMSAARRTWSSATV